MNHSPPRLSVIAAIAQNGVIGRGNQLPWQLPADLAHFKRVTLGKPIIMGRRTFESLPRLLPERRHIVISRDPNFHAPAAVQICSHPNDAVALVNNDAESFIIGGATVYSALLPLATHFYYTRIEAEIEGDVYFPAWYSHCWRTVTRHQHPRDNTHLFDLTFLLLERIAPDPISSAITTA